MAAGNPFKQDVFTLVGGGPFYRLMHRIGLGRTLPNALLYVPLKEVAKKLLSILG